MRVVPVLTGSAFLTHVKVAVPTVLTADLVVDAKTVNVYLVLMQVAPMMTVQVFLVAVA